MDTGVHYAEYATTQKPEGKFATRRILFIVGYIVIIGGMIGLFSAIFQDMAFVFGFVFLVLGVALIFFTWRFTKPDYKYVVETGDIKFYMSYGKRYKLVAEAKIKDAEAIAPYTDEYNAAAKDAAVTYDYRGTAKTPDAYFITFTKNGKKVAVLFEGTEKAVSLLHYYNKATVKREGFRH